jgi:hypothetical protein
VAEAEGDEFMRGRAAEWLVEATLRLTQKTKDETQKLMERAMRNNL